MTGPASYARCADSAAVARDRLDRVAASAAAVENAQRTLVADLLELWPTSAWIAAGATSAKRWLLAYTHSSEPEAHRLERIAGLCHRHPTLADAVLSGQLALSRADTLGRAVTDEREPWLADSLDTLLRLNARGCPAEDWSTAIRHWSGLVDQERSVLQVPRHSLTMTQRLFGGGEIHADLSPSAFLNVATAIDAWTDDPDPADGPYQRGLGERRADALDDVCRAALDPDDTRWGATTGEVDDVSEWEDVDATDTFDGWAPTDTLDEALTLDDDTDADGDPVDLTDPLQHLAAIRRRLRRAETCRRRRARRRTRARSAVRVNVHIDLRTLAGLRDVDDLDDLVLRGDGWALTKEAAERLLCDSAMVAVLFDGKGHILDANDTAETWTPRQRRAIAARDQHCVFPSCTRPPRHCDVHHLHHRTDGGPTNTANGALLCRSHHRLLHEYGWTLTVQDGRWTATDPHGTRWTGRPRAPDQPTHQNVS
jgi:hypothetical protein